jgi:hypothetical protein
MDSGGRGTAHGRCCHDVGAFDCPLIGKHCALFRTTLDGCNLARTSFIPKHACFFKRFSAIRSWRKVLRFFKRFVRSNSPFRLHRRESLVPIAIEVPNNFFSSDLGQQEWLDQAIAASTVAGKPDRTLTRSHLSIPPRVLFPPNPMVEFSYGVHVYRNAVS